MEASFDNKDSEQINKREGNGEDVFLEEESTDWRSIGIGSLFVFIAGMLCFRGIEM